MKVLAVGKPAGCKLLRISAELSRLPGGAILLESISIHGDFFAIPEEKFEDLEKRLGGHELSLLAERYDALIHEMGIQAIGISGLGILSTIQGAIDETFFQGIENRL